jgi:response regulator NasT
MNRALRIAVADDEAFMRDYYREILPLLGHQVVAAAQNGQELIEQCRAVRPDLIVTDIRMPGLDGIDAAHAVAREVHAPVILVSAYHDAELIERAQHGHILAYLIKPIKQPELATTIALAVRRYAQFQALRREAGDLRQALEDRKVVERAKGVLMKKARLGEEEAHRRLQQFARDHNKKLADMARTILIAEQVLQAPNGSPSVK